LYAQVRAIRVAVGSVVGWIVFPIWLVLHIAAVLVSWALCILPFPIAWVIGRGDDFYAWARRTSDWLTNLAAVPLRLAGWISGEEW
jgi:hypothetical protein